MTSEVAASDAVVASEITRLRMKERENQVILPPDITANPHIHRSLSSWISPQETPDRADGAPGVPQTWRPNVVLSIKKQFMILKSHLERCCAWLELHKTLHPFNEQ